MNWHDWLPSRGNVVFTLVIMTALFWAQSANALPWSAPNALTTSTGTWPYQGRLADSAGNPITDTVPMIFRLYNSADSGAVPLWEEQWTGPNSVQVSDGLFNVMLGSVASIPQNVITSNENLWLGITAGTDDEMTPRVQLGSMPYAVQALTVPDGSITAEKFAEGAIPPGVPVGTVISWWRADANTPLPSGDWAIANGATVNDPESPLNGQTLPDLTDRFVMGVTVDNIGSLGGSNTLDIPHSHTLPSHSHTVSGDTTGADSVWDGGYFRHDDHYYRSAVQVYASTSAAWYYRHSHSINLTSGSWSGNTNQTTISKDNRPQYIGLIYIIRIK